MLCCDWGSTSLRVFALDSGGAVIGRRGSKDGLLRARKSGFEPALSAAAGDWLAPERRVLLTGMVGARGGWVEAPYCPAPAGAAELAAQLTEVPCGLARIAIAPGVSLERGGRLEVMRSEETQVIGALAAGGGDGTYVLPGTHTKWVEVEGGRIVDFTTYITGDVYAAVRSHTVLEALLPPDGEWDWDGGGFAEGVEEGAATAGGGELLSRLFAVRTKGLADPAAVPHLGPFLSGMLLGAELADARGSARLPATIIGEAGFVGRYRAAAEVLGFGFVDGPEDAAAIGLAELGRISEAG